MAKQVLSIGDTGTDLVNKFNNNADDLYDGQNIQDLTTGAAPDGTEQVPAFQNGNGVYLTTEQLAGGTADDIMGAKRDKLRYFTRFLGPVRGTLIAKDTTTVDQAIPAEPSLSARLDHTATAAQLAFFSGFNGGVGGVALQVDDGYAVCSWGLDDVPWDTNREIDFRLATTFTAGNLPSELGDEYEMYVGVFDAAGANGAALTEGTFFRASNANANWEYYIGDGTTDTGFVDTGVALRQDFLVNPEVLRIRHNGTDNQTEFYINDGGPVATVADSTQPWFEGDGTPFNIHPTLFGVYVRTINSTATSGPLLSAMRLDIEHDMNARLGNDLI